MENNEIKLEDKIIVSKNGTKFIFPAYAVDTQEKLKEKVLEYSEKAELALRLNDEEGMKKANEMLNLFMTQAFSADSRDCQDFYIKNGFDHEPTRSPEEREAAKAVRSR